MGFWTWTVWAEMRIDVISIFPEYLDPPVRQSLPGKAIESGIVDFAVHDLRRWTHDVHHSVDDAPVRRWSRHGDESSGVGGCGARRDLH